MLLRAESVLINMGPLYKQDFLHCSHHFMNMLGEAF
jgi:hypothetical protein